MGIEEYLGKKRTKKAAPDDPRSKVVKQSHVHQAVLMKQKNNAEYIRKIAESDGKFSASKFEVLR